MSEPGETAAPELVEQVLRQALAQQASDIYWLPRRDRVEVRFRVNGVQQAACEVAGDLGAQCLTHLKVLAGLLTYRTQIAQDGVIRRQAADRHSELRVATMPTLYGERITIRILDKSRTPMFLEELGLPPEPLTVVRRILRRPHGLFVLTGPTGCGKTTTIYALIRELLRERLDPASIITLEDPVESVLDGVSQATVTSDRPEWNYEMALRAALRQDVKTLVVGELRDPGVVRVALDAALTGHRVITTYHAGDVASVYARLLHQGFEPFLVAAAVTGVIAQRLVPGTNGGRVPVMVVMEPDDAWREFICGRPGLGEIRARLAAVPWADLRAAAARLVAAGSIAAEAAALVE